MLCIIQSQGDKMTIFYTAIYVCIALICLGSFFKGQNTKTVPLF